MREIDRPPKQEYPPTRPVVPKFCRYHPATAASAAVLRPGGAVLLCAECGEQVRDGTLYILDALGRYRGHVIPF